MQLFLASLLSCAALLIGVLAQTDWKPYSTLEGGIASLSDESRLFSGASPFDANESLARWINYRREAPDKATEKIVDRKRDVTIHPKETKLMSESTGLLARHNGRAFAFTDSNGRAVRLDFDFSEHSFELLAKGGSKEKIAKAKKFFSAVSAIAEREIRKELIRNQREGRSERRQAQRDAEDEVTCTESAAPVEAKGWQANPNTRSDRTERSNQ